VSATLLTGHFVTADVLDTSPTAQFFCFTDHFRTDLIRQLHRLPCAECYTEAQFLSASLPASLLTSKAK
jgi:hypothetical protein